MRNPEDDDVVVDQDNIKVTLPSSVTTIGYESFRYCRGIKRLETPTSLETIGDYAFADCDSLVEANVLGSYLGEYMFYSNYALETVHLGAVQTIPVGAFYRCFNLTKLNDTDDTDGIDEIIIPSLQTEALQILYFLKPLKELVRGHLQAVQIWKMLLFHL